MKKRGFTLIELLVVIAIISLLVSILLPSLQTARQLAQNVKCSANLKTLSTANHMYAQEYDDIWACQGAWNAWMNGASRYWGENGSGWAGTNGYPKSFLADELVPYFLGETPPLKSANYGMVTGYTICPSYSKTYSNTAGYGAAVVVNSGEEASVYGDGTSYIMTHALATIYSQHDNWDFPLTGTRGSTTANPAEAAWLFDSFMDCSLPSRQYNFYNYHGDDYKPNVAYADGHVSTAQGEAACKEIENHNTQLKYWRGG